MYVHTCWNSMSASFLNIMSAWLGHKLLNWCTENKPNTRYFYRSDLFQAFFSTFRLKEGLSFYLYMHYNTLFVQWRLVSDRGQLFWSSPLWHFVRNISKKGFQWNKVTSSFCILYFSIYVISKLKTTWYTHQTFTSCPVFCRK